MTVTEATDIGAVPENLRHEGVINWVTDMVALTKPADVVWCDGSDAE